MLHPKFGQIPIQTALEVRKSLEDKASDLMLENPDYSAQLYSKVVEWDEYIAVLNATSAFTKQEDEWMAIGLKARTVLSVRSRTGCSLKQAYERVKEHMDNQFEVPALPAASVVQPEIADTVHAALPRKRGNPNAVLCLTPIEEDLLASGLKTEAIKNIRNRTGATVRAVRDFVNEELERINYQLKQQAG